MNRVAELGIAVDTWAPPPSVPPVNGTPLGSGRPRAGLNGTGGGGSPSLLGSLLQWAAGSDTDEPWPEGYSARQQQQQLEEEQGGRLGGGGAAAAAAGAGAQQQQRPRPQGRVPPRSAAGGGAAAGAGAGAAGGMQRLDPATMTRRINWLNSIRQWQEEFVGTLTGGRAGGGHCWQARRAASRGSTPSSWAALPLQLSAVRDQLPRGSRCEIGCRGQLPLASAAAALCSRPAEVGLGRGLDPLPCAHAEHALHAFRAQRTSSSSA